MAEGVGSLDLGREDRAIGEQGASADYSEAVGAFLGTFDALLASSETEALEQLAAWEKKARLGHDVRSNTKLCLRWANIHADRKDWAGLGETLKLLAKKRGQLKGPIIALVGAATKWAQALPDRDTRVGLLEILASLSEGKIYLEVERARLVKMLAGDAEERGEAAKASELLGSVHVEALGGMERREKTEYIIEQMRLALAIKDYIRLEIISRKINPKLLLPTEFADLRLAYHIYLVLYHNHQETYDDTADSQLAICQALITADTKGITISLDSPIFKGITTSLSVDEAIEAYLIYAILSPIGETQRAKLQALLEMKEARDLSHCINLARDYISDEIMALPLEAEARLAKSAPFQENVHGAKDTHKLFHTRILQHNILVVGKYYKSILTTRLASLCFTDPATAEELAAALVNEDLLEARIDRPGGIIRFGTEDDMPQRLDGCHRDLKAILALAEETTHMIQKEDAIRVKQQGG